MIKSLVVTLTLAFIIQCDAKTVKQLNPKKPISFNERNSFGAAGFGGTWISPSEFTYSSGGNRTIFDMNTKTSRVLLDSSFSQKWSGASLTFSPNLDKILVRYASRQIFRHSSVARFKVVFMNDLTKDYDIGNGEELQICTFSSGGASLIYIRDNTIFYVSPSNITNSASVQISPPGVPGVIYYGIPDWVYEEEVLGSDAAAWASPDGKNLAYASFDDTDVETFTYELYADYNGNFLQYPKEEKLKYPKVGTNNPLLGLTIQNVENVSQSPYQLKNASRHFGNDHILGTVFWITDTKLGVIWTNRRQNHGILVSYSPPYSDYEVIMNIEEPDGWIELNTPSCKNGVCYFINNDKNWPSLTKVDTNTSPATINVITKDKHVLNFYGVRDDRLFYLSTPAPNESFNRHIYEYDMASNREVCITCQMQSPEGNKCTYVSASFSTDLSYHAISCSGPNPNYVTIHHSDFYTTPYEWQTNKALRDRLKEYELPRVEIFHVPVAGDFQAAVKMLLPPEIDFDNYEQVKDKYPLLVRVYGGPGSVRINSAYSVGYQSYQVTTKKYIYVEIDGRGTGQKGVDMMFAVNNRLGTYEMEDQIAVTKYLINKYKFIDESRVSIWGWSYGGYATAMTLAQDTEMVFKCGVSVAPVTSWIFYDTIYTERYMGFDPYAKHYNDSDVSNEKYVDQIGKHEFLLIHGNADDNVHYQQSMILARAMELKDIMFDQMSYPDEAHSLSGVSLHLYHSLDRFWDKCFK